MKKLGIIVLVGILVFGQPLTTLAETLNNENHSNEVENSNIKQSTSSQNTDSISVNSMESASISSNNTEILGYLSENQSANSDVAPRKNSQEYIESSDSTPSSESIEKLSIPEEGQSISYENEPNTLVELVSGNWGTVEWTWDENTKMIELESGVAGTVATAPWKTYSDSVITVKLNGSVTLPANSSQLFLGNAGRLPNLTTIENSQYFNTSNVTNMSAMFQNLTSLQSIDVSTWDTSNVTNMFGLFEGLSNIPELDVSNWDVRKVIEMDQMFSNVSSLQRLDLSSWNTRNVREMFVMFIRMTNLTELVIGLDTVFLSQTGLPAIPVKDGYTGYWIRILDSEGNAPNVTNRFTSRELTDNNTTPIPGTYVWERLESQPVTVKYIDLEGNVLEESILIEGEIGAPYETQAKEITGWHVVETPDNASGTFTENPQEVTYVYDRSNAAPVTLRYEDIEGTPLSEPIILNGKVGLPYESNAKEISGWDIVETPDNASGIFTENPQEVTYVYDRSNAAPVTVRYEDTEGTPLSEPIILNGKVGLPYETKAKEFSGWDIVETPDSASGTFTENPQEVTYIYDRSNAAPVTVRYEDTEGTPLSEPIILNGKVGLPYQSNAKEISGWGIVETPDNASGTFTENSQEVMYIYDRSNAAPVTVRYEDTEGTPLSEPIILNGKVGLPYETKVKEISGWDVVETPGNASGVFNDQAQEVIYIYTTKKNSNEQNNPDNNISNDNNFPDINKRFPNTGESSIGQLSMILGGALIMIGVLVFLVKKRMRLR